MIVESDAGVTLAGGAPFGRAALRRALELAPVAVAADGGGDRLLRWGTMPAAVIGDLDSLSGRARRALGGIVHHLPEQETTDFDKALRSIRAPFVLALGFAGARLDHGLAVLNGLARHADRCCLVLSPTDVTFLAPLSLSLDLPVGTRVSLFPLGPVRGRSQGLEWPIEGLNFAPDGQIGTSNRVTGPVHLRFDAPRMLVILPIRALSSALTALGQVLPSRPG